MAEQNLSYDDIKASRATEIEAESVNLTQTSLLGKKLLPS